MILFMLDTGLRASELCSLKIGELDLRTGKVVIKHGDEGGAKGGCVTSAPTQTLKFIKNNQANFSDCD